MNYIDPYHRLGLQHNPFIVTETVGVAESLWIDFGFPTPIAGQKTFIQVMGEKGAGKTSHLLYWQKKTKGSYCYYPMGLAAWKIPPVEDITYWDEANRIPYLLLVYALWQASQKHSTVVVGTHNDLSFLAYRFAFKVEKIILNTLSVESLHIWVKKRIESVLLPGVMQTSLELKPEVAQQIVLQSGDSWRQAAVLLHIWAANFAFGDKSL